MANLGNRHSGYNERGVEEAQMRVLTGENETMLDSDKVSKSN